MKVAIVGFGIEGRVSAAYYAGRGHDVTVCDHDTSLEIPRAYEQQLGDAFHDLDRFDIIVRSAGIPRGDLLKDNPTIDHKITSAVNEFLQTCPTRNVIGVTGTKGKGTTTTLIAQMLAESGRTVHFGGNIGRSPLEFTAECAPDDWVVLELSSFQLSDLTVSPHIAVCLMVVPEHLNWHVDMKSYLDAKKQLFAGQTADDIAIYFAENANTRDVAAAGKGKKIPYFQAPGAYVEAESVLIEGNIVCSTADIRLLGAHNLQNVCAAVTAVWYAGIHDLRAIRTVLKNFTGLEHRLEFVRSFNEVDYYDDSFGTTPETAIVALESFTQPKIIILGGSDKGASYNELATAVATGNVRHALLIGDQAERIRAALEKAGFTAYSDGGTTMSEIVARARAKAMPGDVVLLSTACASFGLFRDYKDRGSQFKQAVNDLVEE